MIAEKRAKNREAPAARSFTQTGPTVPIKDDYLERFFRAAAAPFFPKAVRTRDGNAPTLSTRRLVP
jgi:hypothetical protein